MNNAVSILVIDDEKDVVDSISFMLRQAADKAKCPLTIHTALTGLDGLVISQNTRIDAIFIDYYLRGGLNGDEFLQRLNERATNALIIMMSGRPEDELATVVAERHRSLGLRFRYLKKPLSPLTVESCFRNLLDLRRSDDTVLVVTPKPIEWEAWRHRLAGEREISAGFLLEGHIGAAGVVVALTGKGQTPTAAAMASILSEWQPRYVFIVGIAGGVGDARRGDVVVSSFVYSFDYGKIENGAFRSRPEPNWSADKRLLDIATILADDSNSAWKARIRSIPTGLPARKTRVHIGYCGSSDKVIDDLQYPVIVDALKTAPEILAVEMEAIGANAAIREMHANGKLKSHAGLIMVRGISDEPADSVRRTGSGRAARGKWSAYASEVAAAFTEATIRTLYPSDSESETPMATSPTGETAKSDV